MSNFWLHPAWVMLAGAALAPVVPARLRKGWLVLVPVLALGRTLALEPGIFGQVQVADWVLVLGRVDRLSLVFGYIMSLMALLATLYGLHVRRVGEHVAAWVYVAGSLGAIYAGDLLTLFVFWELMSFSSVFLIWYRGRPQSLSAGYRYLLVHLAGGVALLAGIVLHYRATGSLAFDAFNVAQPSLATYLVMIGFILNAAVPPLHAWLPDAYAEATFNGSVFLSAFTTKTAVYALARGLPGLDVLVPLGVIMAVYGVVYAVLENDSRRLLAYHIISQVGYMVAGVGLADLDSPVGRLALNGVCAHAFAHILYKGLLFMGTGAVLHMTGESRFTHLGGLYAKMPWTFVFTLVGGLSISGFPLFSGFVSKSMIVTASFEDHRLWAGFGLMLASSGTFLHTGLKVPYFIWFGQNRCAPAVWERAADPGWNMNLAMAITSALCVWIGCFPSSLYGLLPLQPVVYQPYTGYHVSQTLQVLLFTGLGFFVFLKTLMPEPTISLDTDWFYRMGGRAFARLASGPVQAVDRWVGQLYRRAGLATLVQWAQRAGRFDQRIIDGAVDGLAALVMSWGSRLRRVQRAHVQESLLLALGMTALVLVGVVLYRNLAP
jgi:multicomponent Na+:H+ antiporter subunit D